MILALDYSLHAGYAVLSDEGESPTLVAYGTIHLGKTVSELGAYPWCYVNAAKEQAEKIVEKLVKVYRPEKIVLEETNGSSSRYSQKILEFLHLALLEEILAWHADEGIEPNVVYINTSDWRRIAGVWLNKEQKNLNAKLARAKRKAAKEGKKLDKKKLGIAGKITKKHVAVMFANKRFNLNLKVKDNDAAEAIGLGLALLSGSPICTGF